MTVYSPTDTTYHIVHPPVCPVGGHAGAHRRDKSGKLRYTKEGSPIVEGVESVTCSPECEKFLVTHGWTRQPPAPPEEVSEPAPLPKRPRQLTPNPMNGPFGPKVLPLRPPGG